MPFPKQWCFFPEVCFIKKKVGVVLKEMYCEEPDWLNLYIFDYRKLYFTWILVRFELD